MKNEPTCCSAISPCAHQRTYATGVCQACREAHEHKEQCDAEAQVGAIKKAAWETRREKYGERGHSGSYAAHGRCGACQSMTDMIVRLHVEGVLSEGQAAKATGLDRVALRIKADAFSAQYAEEDAERASEERRKLEDEAMAEHFRKHPHG